jgi:hypothetical protein
MFGLVGGMIWWRGGFLFWKFPDAAPTVATWLFAVGMVCGLEAGLAVLMGLRRLPVNQLVYWVLTAVGFPIGFVLSFVLLGLLFFAVLTPIGLFFRLIGRDALQRRLEPERETYWQPHEKAQVARYFKQF